MNIQLIYILVCLTAPMLHKKWYTVGNIHPANAAIRKRKYMFSNHLASSIKKSGRALLSAIPIIIGMLLLTSLAIKLFPADKASQWFGQWELLDVFIGAGLGSIAAGHPLASYLLGGELLAGGVSLLAVTALIVSWVTVGFIQLPAEMLLIGKRFAIYRNVINFLLAILVAFFTVYTLRLFD